MMRILEFLTGVFAGIQLFGGVVVAVVAIASYCAWRAGLHRGRRLGSAEGQKTGFLDGRRSERAEGAAPQHLMSPREMISRHNLRMAAALASGRPVRLVIDRQGYVTGFHIVYEAYEGMRLTGGPAR